MGVFLAYAECPALITGFFDPKIGLFWPFSGIWPFWASQSPGSPTETRAGKWGFLGPLFGPPQSPPIRIVKTGISAYKSHCDAMMRLTFIMSTSLNAIITLYIHYFTLSNPTSRCVGVYNTCTMATGGYVHPLALWWQAVLRVYHTYRPFKQGYSPLLAIPPNTP